MQQMNSDLKQLQRSLAGNDSDQLTEKYKKKTKERCNK